MVTGPTSDGQPLTIEELLALDLPISDGGMSRRTRPAPHGMGTAKACVECMNEVELGATARKAPRPVRRGQDELPEATVAMLVKVAADIVRSGQNTVDSAKDYRGYVAQALVLLAESTTWVELDTSHQPEVGMQVVHPLDGDVRL